MTQALYRKWRPRVWQAVVGQEHVVQTLRNAVASGHVAHAYLFAGPRGTGKTTTARLLAKAVNCLDPDPAARPCDRCDYCQSLNEGRFLDLIEIDAASNTSVDDVRDLREKINFSPNQGKYKVYLIDEVHMLSTAAFNALLKTLEEPPPHAIFILVTTEVHKIPATILSRCQRHEFRRIPVADIVAHLKKLAAEEHFQVTPEAIGLIARQATGSIRDAQSLLDQLASTGQPITLELAHAVLGTATNQAVFDLVDALLAGEAALGLDGIHNTLDAGSDPRQFARQIVDYLRNLLLSQMGSADQLDATADARVQMALHAQALPASLLLEFIRIFNRAAVEGRATWQPSLPLEIAFIESLNLVAQPTPSEPPPVEPPEPAPPAVTARRRARYTPATDQAAPTEEGPAPLPESAPAEDAGDQEKTVEPADRQATQLLVQRWRQVLGLVRAQNPNTYGLLNSCKSRYLKGNILILGFASNVLKNQMLKKENLDIVSQALAQVLERPVAIRCEITAARRNSIPPDVEHDGMVAAALRDLGGEIVDVQ